MPANPQDPPPSPREPLAPEPRMSAAAGEERGGSESESDAQARAVVRAALPCVAFDGWSWASLCDGAAVVDVDRGSLAALFPAGVADAIDVFAFMAIDGMLAAAGDVSALKVRQRITVLIRAYLEGLEPHREAYRRLIAELAMPDHLGLGLRITRRTVDAMWYAAGDTATDFSYYTKRATLAAVLAATAFYWLDDTSEGRRDSWAFLDRRIAEVMWFGRTTAAARAAVRTGVAGGLANGVGGGARAVFAGLRLLPDPRRFVRLARERAAATP